IFTQKIANIEPSKQIDVNIKYFHTLSYDDGFYEFVFPMVVGPRFNPPDYTDGIGAVSSAPREKSDQKSDVHYLSPAERSGHDISLAVHLDAGVSVEKIESRNQKINVTKSNQSTAEIALDPSDSIPNKDFVLRYQVAGKQLKTALLTHRDQRGGFFTLMLFTPADLSDLPRQPLEMVFTLDVS